MFRFTINYLLTKLRGRVKISISVWITPYNFILDFQEFIESWGLGESVFILETSSFIVGDEKKLAAKIWPLSKINLRYKELFSILTELRGRVKISIDELRKLRSEYLKILREDPCLPKELLPEKWYREKVEEEMRRLK